MALTRISSDTSSSIDPLLQLRKLISELLPHQGLPLIDKVRRWSDRLLILCALLMSCASGSSLRDRFNQARSNLVELYPTRKRPGESYNGFIDCLTRHSARLLVIVTTAFRKRVIQLAGGDWRTFGFIVFGADGTKIEVPRTDANIAHFGVANKKHAGPEMLLCCLFHLTTRSLWSFAHDIAKGSERALLALMIPCLPKDSLILADAGFVGWNTMTALIDAGQHFIIRAGANVKLLRELGCYVKEYGDIVHLWPDKQQKKNVPPIILRRVMVRDGKGREMCLLTNLLKTDRLSDSQIIELYKMRWNVEVAYRWLKESMQGRKMLSDSPMHACVELDWTMMSLWMLTLLSLAAGVPGEKLSVSGTLRAVREAMTQRRCLGVPVAARINRSRRDSYSRLGKKSKRHYPKRSRLHRCGVPVARSASIEEIAKYQAILLLAS